jgi:hypothetical protein
VVVDVGLLAVLALFVLLVELMGMGEHVMVVFVCVPVGPVVPLPQHAAAMVVGDVVVVVGVRDRGMGVLRLTAFALDTLFHSLCCHNGPSLNWCFSDLRLIERTWSVHVRYGFEVLIGPALRVRSEQFSRIVRSPEAGFLARWRRDRSGICV